MHKNLAEIRAYCQSNNMSFSSYSLQIEKDSSDMSMAQIHSLLDERFDVMMGSIEEGLERQTAGKIIGGDAQRVMKRAQAGLSLGGELLGRATAYALAVMELNVSMGRIVACPTAGSSGVLPAVLKSLTDKLDVDRRQIREALLTAGLIGMVIGRNASLSGADGGCQAEVGSASAMAAAAAVVLSGGSDDQVAHAAAICLKNLMGLVCDPVAGLVEVPCAKRNTIGTANALIAADMALADVPSYIPFDEVVAAMHRVGRQMPASLRETAEGGIAITPTAKRFENRIFQTL